MDRTENAALIAAGALMTLFFAALVWTATALDIDVPTCVTDVEPFRDGRVIDRGEGRYEVQMVAKMWAFEPAEVRLPPGAEVDLYVSALDVTHGLHIEGTNVNLMAVPGVVNAARFRVPDLGEHAIICHEYCGVAHHHMVGRLIVAEGAVATEAEAVAPPAASDGAALFTEKNCDACHSVDGSDGVGPTLQGLFGREVRLADGSTLRADETYVAESIRDPTAHVVDGYDPLMPAVPVTDDELRRLLDYLRGVP